MRRWMPGLVVCGVAGILWIVDPGPLYPPLIPRKEPTVSNDQKQPPAAPKPSRPEAIRIKQLRFEKSMDIPGKGMENSVTGVGPDATDARSSRHTIEYQPWVRSFAIAWFEGNASAPKKTIYVPEARVLSWEPW
jgi:hypothetical protein